MHNVYPFSAIVGQDRLKLALILNAVNPRIGGVLIRGEKGTAKSTTVRALAALLPMIEVVGGCAYSCDPDNPSEMCDRCRLIIAEIGNFFSLHDRITRIRTRVVTLPLNATEDRVVGGIDFEQAIKKGIRALQPGLLARAHRGFLYVDEVNLLDDHIVDIILDAASSGENIVEREGISVRHPANFLLVGTMNPEEGELRPHFLDRFGLCVEVIAETDMENRVLLMQRREEYDAGPKEFIARFEIENARISEKIVHARETLRDVRFPEHLRTFVSELCRENNVAGHRADLVMEQAARAFTALGGRSEVTIADIHEVASLTLAHRRRDAASPPLPPPPEDHRTGEDTQEKKEGEEQTDEENRNVQEKLSERQEEKQDFGSEGRAKNHEQEVNSRERIFDVGATFKVRKITSPRDRIYRRGSGRRSRTQFSQKQGRYIKSAVGRKNDDIALDATLRAAAPYQLDRKKESGLAVCLRREDIREKIREKRIGNFLLFLVDASGSMGARGRMVASKGAVMSLLLDAYQKRDRVAMVSFRRNESVVNLSPTSSVELAARLLEEMPVGGRTPLSAGLLKGFELLRNELLKEPSSRPIVIIITDGKSNMAMGDKKPVEEALALASKMALDKRIRFIVVDTEDTGLVSFGLAIELAAAMDAQYFKINDLKSDELTDIVRGRIQ